VSAHLAVNAAASSEGVLQRATKLLKDKFGFHTTTIQVEDYKAAVMNSCEMCQPLQ
jgi:hypothetical protein